MMCNSHVIKKDMHEHFAKECPNYLLKCKYCSVEMQRKELETHRCYQMFVGTKKGGPDYYFTKSRISNLNDMKAIIEQLQCAVCKHLMRQP